MSSTRAPIDYSSIEVQIAYAFRCLAAHGDLLHRTLIGCNSHVLSRLTGESIKVACVGGGPGSDALGFVKFAERQGLTAKPVEFVFLDREPAWQTVRSALFPTFGTFPASSRFVQTDLATGSPWTSDWSFIDADLFTFSFALSEVWAFDGSGSVSNFLNFVISGAKSGAMFAYTDNGGPSFLPLAEKIFEARADLTRVFTADDTWMLIGGDEQQSAINGYITRFGQESKKTGNVNRRLWAKV